MVAPDSKVASKLSGKHKKVAFITDATAATPFAQRILSGVAEYMQKQRGFVLQNIPFTEILSDSLNRRFDGIIINLCAENTRKLLGTLNGAKLPIVDTGAEIEDPALIRVDLDIVREGTMSAEWFLRRGFRNFAYCGFHGSTTYPFDEILEDAFASTVRKAGCRCLVFDMPPVTNEDKQYLHFVQAAIEEWTATLPPRTAVLCIQDRRASILAQACLTLGRAVPEDIAVYPVDPPFLAKALLLLDEKNGAATLRNRPCEGGRSVLHHPSWRSGKSSGQASGNTRSPSGCTRLNAS